MIVQHALFGSGDGMVNWRIGITGAFISRNGTPAHFIKYDPTCPMAVVHELGHLLDCRFMDLGRMNRALGNTEYGLITVCRRDFLHLIRAEIRAWRIAKSICKPELWNEVEALGLRGLGSYVRWVAIHGNIRIDRAKLRIIPLNRGVGLTGEADSVISK